MKIFKKTSPQYTIEAVERALDVLEAFHGSERLTLAEISQRVGLNKSRVFRLLHTLSTRGYIERSLEGGYYSLGLKLCERASAVRLNLKQVALPYMHQINHRFNETVNLGMLDAGDVLYIEILESAQSFRVATTIGKRSPLHSSSLGKAIAAYLDESALATVISPKRLAKRTERTITDPEKVKAELEKVRRRGYSVDDGEDVQGAACIGAPIFDSTGKPVAAISVSGPAERIAPRREEIARSLAQSCGQISAYFGWQPGTVESARLSDAARAGQARLAR